MSACHPTAGGRYFMKRYGLTCHDANQLALHPKLKTIVRTVDARAVEHEWSPSMTRAHLLDKVASTRTSLAGTRRRRRRR